MITAGKLGNVKSSQYFPFTDRSLDNQAAIEFSFVFEPPKEKKVSRSSKRSLSLSSGRDFKEKDLSEFSRADSYENFDRPEGR